MPTVLYTVTSRELPFNGKHDLEELNRGTNCWYEGTDDPEARLFYKIFQNN